MKKILNEEVTGKCSSCLVGKKMYELDNQNPMCPYLLSYKAENCPYYVKVVEAKNLPPK